MAFFHSKPVHYGLILAMAAALATTSCERSVGPYFPGLSAAPQGEARIYLYRRGALAAYAQGFDVRVDGKARGRLTNASYLVLSLSPGSHTLQVHPGGAAVRADAAIEAAAGANAFYEFVFPDGWEMRPSFAGARIEMRSQSRAVADLKNLRQKDPVLVQESK